MPPSVKAKAQRAPKTKWKAAPPELSRCFVEAVAHFPAAELRKMFGYPAAFVNGHMIGGLFQDRVMLRLSPEDVRAACERQGAKPFEPMPGRIMREYVELPKASLRTAASLRAWFTKAIDYTSGLPAKRSRRAATAGAPAARPRRRA